MTPDDAMRLAAERVGLPPLLVTNRADEVAWLDQFNADVDYLADMFEKGGAR